MAGGRADTQKKHEERMVKGVTYGQKANTRKISIARHSNFHMVARRHEDTHTHARVHGAHTWRGAGALREPQACDARAEKGHDIGAEGAGLALGACVMARKKTLAATSSARNRFVHARDEATAMGCSKKTMPESC